MNSILTDTIKINNEHWGWIEFLFNHYIMLKKTAPPADNPVSSNPTGSGQCGANVRQ
jgi:hypothetical protein